MVLVRVKKLWASCWRSPRPCPGAGLHSEGSQRVTSRRPWGPAGGVQLSLGKIRPPQRGCPPKVLQLSSALGLDSHRGAQDPSG